MQMNILIVMNKELARIGDRLDKVERNMDQLRAEIGKLIRKQALVGQQVAFAKKEMAFVDLITHESRSRIQKVQRAIQEACKEYDDADVIPRHFRNPRKRRRKSLIIYDHNNQENSE